MSRHSKSRLIDLQVNEALYLIGFAGIMLRQLIVKVNSVTIFDIPRSSIASSLVALSTVALIVKCLTQRYSARQFVVVAVLCAMGAFVTIDSGSSTYSALLLFVVAGLDVKLENLARVSLVINVVFLTMVLLAYWSGALAPVYMVRNGVLMARNSLGFTQPNYFGRTVINILMSWAVLRHPKFGVAGVALFVASSYLIMTTADSYTSVAIVIFAAALFLLLPYVARLDNVKPFLVVMVVVVAFAIIASVYFLILYSPSNALHKTINSLMHGRPAGAHARYVQYGLTLFGSNASRRELSFMEDLGYALWPDNAYARFLLTYGIVPSAILFAAYVGTMIRSARSRHLGLCVVGLMIFSVLGITERWALDFTTNYFMIVFTDLLYGIPLEINDESIRELSTNADTSNETSMC